MHENDITEAAAHEAGSGKTLAVLTGIGIGAALMYFLDAERGADRRQRVADTARKYIGQGSDADEEPETTYSGEFGARNRATPGRTPRELGLDPEEMRGHGIVGDAPERI